MLFPGGLLPLRIFEQRYMDMAKACLKEDAPFGVCLIRRGAEVGEPAEPEAIGCLARIVSWDMPQLGMLHVGARGERRFRILERRVQKDGLALAAIETLAEETDCPIPDNCRTCARLLERLIERQPGIFESPPRLDSSAWVSARLAETLPLPLPEKQKLLELDDGLRRLGILNDLLKSEGLAPSR